MATRLLVLSFLLTFAAAAAGAVTHAATTWDEALALSRQHGKPILIDFFTEW